MEYKHVSEFTSQALVIEDAEALILAFCKRAVLGSYSRDYFKRGVDKIIENALSWLRYDSLKEKARDGLRAYAQRCYKKERDLLLLHVTAFAVLLKAQADKRREARPLIRKFNSTISEEYRSSRGFQRTLNVTIPDTAYTSAVPLNTYYKEYSKKVEKVFTELVESNAKESYETNVSLRNVAEMTVRYEGQLDMIESKRREGKKLVYILPHVNCSERCEKYQVGGSLHPSGLYSLDGTSGITSDGVKYVPLEFATDNPRDRYVTKAGKVYQNGCLTGFNCRHRLGDYIPGAKPVPIPDAAIKRQRAVEEKQREYERRIRECKKAALIADSKEKRSYFKSKAIDLNEEYRRFSVKNKVSWHPDRVKIFDNED